MEYLPYLSLSLALIGLGLAIHARSLANKTGARLKKAEEKAKIAAERMAAYAQWVAHD